MIEIETLSTALAIIFGAYFIRGITGFGSGLIAVPLLAHFQPLTFVVPIILLLDFSANVIVGGTNRKLIRWDEIYTLAPFSVVGVALGVFLLIRMPSEPLLVSLGLFVLAFGVRSVLNLQGSKPISRLWAAPAGLLGGTVGALFGTGGPPYIIYFTHRLREKSVLRATFAGLFLFDGAFRIIAFLVSGLLLAADVWIAWVAAIPIMLGGLHLGGKVHVGLSNAQMLRLVGLLLVGSGASLIWRAWV